MARKYAKLFVRGHYLFRLANCELRNFYATRPLGYNHLISNKREWNNCFIKNRQQILLDFADFAWLEQPEGNLMESISRVWYNGSYTIAAKPIKTLELHYTMIQFLIIIDIIILIYPPCPF